MTKRTLNGTKYKSIKVTGFRKRIKTDSGKKILSSRRKKGRKKLTKGIK